MVNKFNRNDGTFALVDYSDLSGSGSVGSVVVFIGSVSGVIDVASGIAMAGSSVVASVGSGLAHSAGAIIVNVGSGIGFTSGAITPTAIGFSVHKNGTNQTGFPNNSFSTVTWSTEIYDVGSYFASNTWTPPAGKVSMKAAVETATSVQNYRLAIFKNGSEFKGVSEVDLVGIPFGSMVAIDDSAGGSDAYIVKLLLDNGAGGGGDVSGSTTHTYFMGHWIGT